MLNVLIVDDDAELLEMVCLMVRINNMNAICVGSGKSIFQILEKDKISLILMDIYLGNDDGRQLTRQIKDDKRFKNIPIMLYSAGRISPESIRESHANCFMQKPFDMTVLITKIRDMVNAA